MVIVLMGVTGSGKTTIGQLLAKDLDWKYYDADDCHSRANVEKLRSGVPLNDADRKPWLETLNKLILQCLAAGENAVLACSALKESYRRYLLIDETVKLVYLKADYETIKKRLSERRGHYMNPALLDSQFDTLEEPEQGVHVNATLDPNEIVRIIKDGLSI